ncbi:hypothetical protein [Pseudomonas rustica]
MALMYPPCMQMNLGGTPKNVLSPITIPMIVLSLAAGRTMLFVLPLAERSLNFRVVFI